MAINLRHSLNEWQFQQSISICYAPCHQSRGKHASDKFTDLRPTTMLGGDSARALTTCKSLTAKCAASKVYTQHLPVMIIIVTVMILSPSHFLSTLFHPWRSSILLSPSSACIGCVFSLMVSKSAQTCSHTFLRLHQNYCTSQRLTIIFTSHNILCAISRSLFHTSNAKFDNFVALCMDGSRCSLVSVNDLYWHRWSESWMKPSVWGWAICRMRGSSFLIFFRKINDFNLPKNDLK